MALEQRLRASLPSQLLAGNEPRCFWTPQGVVANPAFEALGAERDAVLAAGRSVFRGEVAQSIDAGAFRWTFTRIVHDNIAGVFVCGVELDGTYDARLTALPKILQFHSGREPNTANLHRLMDLVVKADPRLFLDAVLFTSQSGKPFVLVHNLGPLGRGLRSWSRWPFDRLFTKQRAAIVTNPLTFQQGLAIPFFTPPSERYVIVFPLRSKQLSQADSDFLDVIKCVAALVPPAKPQRRLSVYHRVEPTAIPLAPRLVYYGRPELRARVKGLISAHEWELKETQAFQELLSLPISPFDVLLVDGMAIIDTISLLRWLRHAAPGIPVLFFDSWRDEETEVLIDERISPLASDDQIFSAIKNVVRQIPQRRRDHLEAVVQRLSTSLASASTFMQVLRITARALATHFGDWAAVHLFDLQGQLYHAEFPARDVPLLSEVPMTFINGYAVMKSHVDDHFLAEVCEELHEREGLASLNPRSGAALPLAYGGRLIGSIVVLSTQRDLDETDFEALSEVAELASHAFSSLQGRPPRKDSQRDWTHVSAGVYELDVYHPSNRKRSMLRAEPLDKRTVVIEANDGRGGTLSAILDVEQHVLRYEASHFPAPLYVGATGPAALLETQVRDRAVGTIALSKSSVTLVYDPVFARELDSACVVDTVQRGLRDGAENPAALLPTISHKRIPLMAITLR